MASSPETKYVAYMSMAKQELEWLGGDRLFANPKIDLEIPSDGIGGIPPDRFKLEWKAFGTTRLSHKLHSLVFSHLKTRFILPLPNSESIEGTGGAIALVNCLSPELLDWIKVTKWENVAVTFSFRALASSKNGVSTESLALGQITQHAQNDAVFVFPSQDNSAPRLLWSKSATLVKTSPYFKTLFAAEGFAETNDKIQPPKLADKSLVVEKKKQSAAAASTSTTVSIGKEKATATEQDKEEDETILDQPDWEDSDMETDSFPPVTSSPSIHRITITSVAYKTLFSYLYYLETGIINFSPLTSLLPTSYVPNSSLSSTSVPTCSPKSMYRLSSFYEHQALKELSYTSISSQLDSRNALTELFSDLASDYEEIKSVCTQAVLDNWSFVKDSKEMKEVEREMKEGRLEERKVEKVFELFGKLKPATA